MFEDCVNEAPLKTTPFIFSRLPEFRVRLMLSFECLTTFLYEVMLLNLQTKINSMKRIQTNECKILFY